MEPRANRPRPARGAAAGTARPAGDVDVAEMGGQPPRFPGGSAWVPTIGIAVAALAAGLLLGFIGGHRQADVRNRTSQAAAALGPVPIAAGAIVPDLSACAVQRGHTLQLGTEITNQSDRTIVLRQVKPVLPMGGLRALASSWETCGALPVPGPRQAPSLGPGATGWLTVTFDVLVRCPQPLPVGFRVSYTQGSKPASITLTRFPDLSQVPYRGCPAGAAGR